MGRAEAEDCRAAGVLLGRVAAAGTLPRKKNGRVEEIIESSGVFSSLV